MMQIALNIDFRSDAEKKNENLALLGRSRALQHIAKGPIRGREME